MERCPCCKARLKESVICPRCQADLSLIFNSEQSAEGWLSKAMKYWLEGKTEKSFSALNLSLQLKKMNLTIVFRDFLIQQQCQYILDLLAKKQLLSAKQQLYKLRNLFPLYKQLQQLNTFTDYLLSKSKQQSRSKTY